MRIGGRDYSLLGVSPGRVTMFCIISILAAGLEGFGITMLLPVLEYLEKGRDLDVLAASGGYWAYLVAAFGRLGIPVDLVGLLGVVMVLMFLRVLAIYARQVYLAWFSNHILHAMRVNLFAAYMRAEHSLFDDAATGAQVNLMTVEVPRVKTWFFAVCNVVSNVLVLCCFLVVLVMLNPAMTALAVAVTGLAAGAALFFVRRSREVGVQSTRANRHYLFQMVELLGAARLVKLSAATEAMVERGAHASSKVFETLFWLAKMKAQVALIMEPVVILCSLAMIYLATTRFSMSLATLGLFMLVLMRVQPLAKEVAMSLQNVRGMAASVGVVYEGIADAQARREEIVEGGTPFSAPREAIVFKGVEFTYPGAAHPALDGVDMTMPAGRVTALVGPSGAGKSTLADLLPRLRVPQKGAILFDGVPAGDLDLLSLRRGMAFVSQEPAILNDTVRSNVAFCAPGADDETVWSALEKARAAEFVRALPQGLDTVLGERGHSLSGGQRQRLALARAFVGSPSVLILDEPTSALDLESERHIQEAITHIRETGSMTVVIIAHRLSTIRNADRIIVLDRGKVLQEGSHNELMVSEEWYARVNALQGGGSRGVGA